MTPALMTLMYLDYILLQKLAAYTFAGMSMELCFTELNPLHIFAVLEGQLFYELFQEIRVFKNIFPIQLYLNILDSITFSYTICTRFSKKKNSYKAI